MKISFICPGRNNLKYVKWSYDSIQKNKGDHEVQFCFADDASDDGTWAWCVEREQEDRNFNWIRNMGPNRVGHTILYDRLVKEVAKHEVCIIWHCDMYLAPGALDALEKYLYTVIHTDHAPGGFEYVANTDIIVSLTRVEPPLHPAGVEKITRDFGTEPETFQEEEFLADLKNHPLYIKDKITKGVFAPWAFFKETFIKVGGHDPLFAPQSKEDSDIWNRLLLMGCEFIQTWEGFVYHMTCRGSRFNPTLTQVGVNSSEWSIQNEISQRNFIRKWGSLVKHDKYLNPRVIDKRTVKLILPPNLTPEVLHFIEPWGTWIETSTESSIIDAYIASEQSKTPFDLSSKFKKINEAPPAEIEILYDGDSLEKDVKALYALVHIGEIVSLIKDNYPIEGGFRHDSWIVNVRITEPVDWSILPPNAPIDWKQSVQ